jgi:hypothetical protein
MIGRFLKRKELAACEQSAQLPLVLVVASPSQDLEGDDPRGREWLFDFQGLSNATVCRTPCGSLELDPR